MSVDEKIKTLTELAELRAFLREQGKQVVHCHGIFDLLHVGTVRHFERAKKLGDVLIVSVASDESVAGKSLRLFFNQELRAEAIAALNQVDYVAISTGPQAVEAIELLRPDVFVPWQDDLDSEDGFRQALRSYEVVLRAIGGQMVFLEKPVARPLGLVHGQAHVIPSEASVFLGPFAARYALPDILGYLEKAREQRVLFVGETIIDEYQYCETIGKSGKEPVLAVRYVSTELFAGGILATANQAAAFSDRVSVLTLLGTQDSQERFIREKLDPKIDAMFLYMPGSPTIVKRRLVETYPFQKLFEIYVMDQEVPETVSQALYARLKAILPSYDAVVVTDYGHGMLTPEIIEFLCGQDCFLAINTQTNAANQGYNTVSKYRRADCICLSEKELRLEARNRCKDVRVLMAEIAEKLSCQRMLITRGQQGCLCYQKGAGFFQIPSFTNRIVDRVGAGDAVLAVSALCAAQGAPMEAIGFIGNVVGAQAVETVGNRSVVSRATLFRQIESLMNYDHSPACR